MFKSIEFMFLFVIGIILIVMTFLSVGIDINTFIYKNIVIEKLYLKYDKKLIITTPKITIHNPNADDPIELALDCTIDYNDHLFEIDIKNFKMFKTDITAKGKVYIDQKKINLENATADITIENLDFTFDQKMKNIRANKAFVSYKNNILEASFDQPKYGDIDISQSKVRFLEKSMFLELYLHTKTTLNTTLKQALARYGVEIPFIQHRGKNSIDAQIFIPFSKGKLFIAADVETQDSIIEAYGETFDIGQLNLHYKESAITGTALLNRYAYTDIIASNIPLEYRVSFKDALEVTITSKQAQVEQKQNTLILENIFFHFKNNTIRLLSDIKDKNNMISLVTRNTINLESKKLSGSFSFLYEENDQNIVLYGEDVSYKGSFNDIFTIDFYTNQVILAEPHFLELSNIKVNYQENILKTQLNLKEFLYDMQLQSFATTNLKEKTSKGTLLIENAQYENIIAIKDKDITYEINFADNLHLQIPFFELDYIYQKEKKESYLNSNQPNKILDVFPFVSHAKNTQGSLQIISQDFKNTKILIDNVDFQIHSKDLPKDSKSEKNTKIELPVLPTVSLLYTKSIISYDDIKFPFDSITLKTNENEVDILIQKEGTIIDALVSNTLVSIQGKNLTDKYLNSFLKKDIFEKGYLDLNIYGTDLNFLSGDINFYTTTIKDVAIVNNLLTFVNTTPALLNPLLALPTLFRMAETGFDTSGYYIKDGQGSFTYTIPSKELSIYDLFTNGKMSNFLINSELNLVTQEVNANVDISFLKDFSEALGAIPVVGYIIMGDDGEFHTSIDISGKLDNPNISTNTIKDTSKGVGGVIQRILTLPLKPFDIETSPEQIKEHQKRVKEFLKE